MSTVNFLEDITHGYISFCRIFNMQQHICFLHDDIQ